MGECFAYREALFQLLARDLKLKYQRTSLGYAWSLLNPVLQLTVLTVVFSHIVRLEMKDYTLYLFSGLLVWQFIQTSLMTSAPAFFEQEAFIKKIYLPKILFPFTKVFMRFFDFMLALLALTFIGIIAGFPFKETVLYLPIPVILSFGFTLGASILVAIATVYFRDIEYLIQVFLQLLYFATPILYPLHLLPERYHLFVKLNPIYTQVNLFQHLIYAGTLPSSGEWLAATLVTVVTLGLAIWLMAKTENELVFRL